MYWEWSSLLGSALTEKERASVLASLPPEAAKEVVTVVVRPVVTTLGISQPPSPSSFDNDTEVEWCLQVICFGLSLPFAEHEIIKDCVSIYCEWLSCLAPVPKLSVPKPLVDRPDFYARKMINQLHHLFVPRQGEAQDTINRQAILCHRVLRVLQHVIKTSTSLEPVTWECILLFLISINDAILSPPSLKDDIGDQLCERVLSVLFEVWLLACDRSFPSPPLWKTLRESCLGWRHRAHVFEQWTRINLLLTGRVLKIMYGADYAKSGEDDDNLLPPSMSNDCVVQTWYRFLHTVGNPVELTQPTIISQTQNFLQYAISSDTVVDPCQHPCLSILPTVFHQAMLGTSAMVDAFLGLPPRPKNEVSSTSASIESESGSSDVSSPIPPMRRLAKSFSVATSSSGPRGQQHKLSLLNVGRSKDTSSITSQPASAGSVQNIPSSGIGLSIPGVLRGHAATLLAPGRPKVNSILHLFGQWLFEAALTCPEQRSDGVRRTSRGSVPAALPESIDIPTAITIDKYYQGRAEALGTLCRIFCSKKTGEEILPSYLARFYIAIQKGLKETRQEVLISILSNSPNLLRLDLDGITVLVPSIVSALEAVLPVKDILRNDLRRSAIQLLLSLLSLPLHFLNVPIKEILDKSGQAVSFIQLKPRLANLLINALQAETDSVNIQMLLGGLLLFVTDTALFEDVDKGTMHVGADSPTNLMLSESTSMKSFSDYSSSFDEHMIGIDTTEGPVDSAHALFVRTTYLVCHRLISTWKMDVMISLAALELLNGLARLRIHDQDPLECRRAVKWICDFIIHQCSRPPPAHSKDLHSSIVAAFQCVTTWLTTHPYLLEDKDTLHTVLEVVEYGISGTKSQGKPGEPIKYKDEKELKPVSLRVRDAAEALLAVIFEQVGRYSPQNGVKSSSTGVDEWMLLNQVQSQGELSKEDIIKHFRYFIIDHQILVSLFEEPLGNDEDPQPTVTMILRGPTGRHAWTLQLRHMSKQKGKSSSSGTNNPGRPLPISDLGIRYDVQHRYFPESADRIAFCKADKVIPPLDSVLNNNEGQDAVELSRLSIILENQVRLEKSVENMIREETDENYPNLRTEAQPPLASQEFQTARLLLSHLGFITAQDESDFCLPKLVAIDSTHPDFVPELEALDSTSCCTCDTVHVFYVRAGQKTKEEILANVQSRTNIHPYFLEFILSLGWPVDISQHEGWTGNVRSSWKQLNHSVCSNGDMAQRGRGSATTTQEDASRCRLDSTQRENEIHGGSLYNGENYVLYWTDVTSEIAFVVPTGPSSSSHEVVWDIEGDATSKPGGTPDGMTNEKSKSAMFDKHLDEGNKGKKTVGPKLIDTKIFVVWLESFEDSFHFPASDLMSCTVTGLESAQQTEPSLLIFIHALKNGLFRIRMTGEHLRMGLATPLIDGMVVSRRSLGSLVRQTALNMARRKRLENDAFQTPHVRRKLKIQEIASKYPLQMSPQDFYTHFFIRPTFSSCAHNSCESENNGATFTTTTTVHHV